jgi:hypothetical protein
MLQCTYHNCLYVGVGFHLPSPTFPQSKHSQSPVIIYPKRLQPLLSSPAPISLADITKSTSICQSNTMSQASSDSEQSINSQTTLIPNTVSASGSPFLRSSSDLERPLSSASTVTKHISQRPHSHLTSASTFGPANIIGLDEQEQAKGFHLEDDRIQILTRELSIRNGCFQIDLKDYQITDGVLQIQIGYLGKLKADSKKRPYFLGRPELLIDGTTLLVLAINAGTFRSFGLRSITCRNSVAGSIAFAFLPTAVSTMFAITFGQVDWVKSQTVAAAIARAILALIGVFSVMIFQLDRDAFCKPFWLPT